MSQRSEPKFQELTRAAGFSWTPCTARCPRCGDWQHQYRRTHRYSDETCIGGVCYRVAASEHDRRCGARECGAQWVEPGVRHVLGKCRKGK